MLSGRGRVTDVVAMSTCTPDPNQLQPARPRTPIVIVRLIVRRRSSMFPRLPPNGSRLSCGALEKKVVIQYPTRPASFKRLLGGITLSTVPSRRGGVAHHPSRRMHTAGRQVGGQIRQVRLRTE